MSSSPVIVTTQQEFDAAVSDGADWIRVESPAGVWIEVDTPRETVVVEVRGSATVTASGSATVTAYDSATVTASDSATVRAYDSATVRAYDSATVRAYGSATVHAYDSATVHAYDSATVRASSHVAVHLHSSRAHTSGGVTIDHTAVDLTDRDTWLAYKSVRVTAGTATLYKAVDADLNAGHGYRLTRYGIGDTVTAGDWNPAAVCGGGLHATGDPADSETYYSGSGRCRYLELAVPVDGLVPIDDKVKFRTCTVVREVDVVGRPVDVEAGAR